MNIKIVDPELVNIHVENCVDLQGKLTDFTKILEEYPDEAVISNIHQHCKHKCDSIYSEISFFSSMHDNNLPIDGNPTGALSSLLTESPTISRIYGELNDDEYLILDEVGNPQYRNSNTEVLAETRRPSGTGKTESNQFWKEIPETTGLTVDLVKQSGFESLSTWFLMFWLDRYRVSHKKVKTALQNTYPDSVYYNNFSESVGNLKNIEFIKNTHTMDMTDITSAGDVPYPYSSILNYIMSDAEKRASLDLSKKTHEVFRRNIAPLLEDYTDSAQPHGVNLVVDASHYDRMKQLVTDIHTTLQTSLKQMYDVLLFISNNINSLKVPNVIYKKYVEGLMIDVDLMKNRAKKLQTEVTLESTLKSAN